MRPKEPTRGRLRQVIGLHRELFALVDRGGKGEERKHRASEARRLAAAGARWSCRW